MRFEIVKLSSDKTGKVDLLQQYLKATLRYNINTLLKGNFSSYESLSTLVFIIVYRMVQQFI